MMLLPKAVAFESSYYQLNSLSYCVASWTCKSIKRYILPLTYHFVSNLYVCNIEYCSFVELK